jgi:hypothetical protein
METHQVQATNDLATHGNVLQETGANPTPPINGASEPAKAHEILDGTENIEPAEPEDDGIRYSENVVPVGADEDSDEEPPRSAPANCGVGVQETKKKKRKKKSKSKRGLVTLGMTLKQFEANAG